MKVELPVGFSSGVNFILSDKSVSFELKSEFKSVSHNFHFIIREILNIYEINISVTNAIQSSFEKGWHGYKPFVSSDGNHYSRVDNSEYINGVFKFNVKVFGSSLWIAYYPPYNEKRLQDIFNSYQLPISILKQSGIEFIHLNKNTSFQTVVLLNRQHPGEFQGSYFLEGIVKFYLSNYANYNLLVFPLVNKDGATVSNHRYNSLGQDLNRIWGTRENSLKEIIDIIENQKSLKYIFDIHGDEISKIDYIFTKSKNSLQSTISCFTFLTIPSRIKRVIKHFIKSKTIKLNFGTLAAQYLENRFGVECYIIELSSHKNTDSDCVDLGTKFIKEMVSKDSR